MKKIIIALAALIFTSGFNKPNVPKVEVVVEEHGVQIIAYSEREMVLYTQEVPVTVLNLFEEPDEPIDDIELTPYDIESIDALAHMALGEYNLIDTPEHKRQCAAVIECAMWRVMAGTSRGFNSTPVGVCSQPYQFHGYKPNEPVSEELWLFAKEVYSRTVQVINGADPLEVGCVLPTDYLWFYGTGTVNVFRNAYEGGATWDWSWPNPYIDG